MANHHVRSTNFGFRDPRTIDKFWKIELIKIEQGKIEKDMENKSNSEELHSAFFIAEMASDINTEYLQPYFDFENP